MIDFGDSYHYDNAFLKTAAGNIIQIYDLDIKIHQERESRFEFERGPYVMMAPECIDGWFSAGPGVNLDMHRLQILDMDQNILLCNVELRSCTTDSWFGDNRFDYVGMRYVPGVTLNGNSGALNQSAQDNFEL